MHVYKGVARLKFSRRQPALPSLPLLPLPSLPLPSPFSRFPPLLLARGSGERCELSQWVWGKSPAAERFDAYSSRKELLW